MSDLEKFWHNEEVNVPDLIRIAISHYQFETIHPFLDDNGRIGRLLITLYLVEKGLLQKPSLYLSDFFERNRSSYYDALMAVRTSNNLLHWIKFFLSAVIEIANNGKNTFREILSLRQDVEHRILSLGKRAEKAKRLLQHLYQHPIIDINSAAQLLDLSHQATSGLFKEMVKLAILEEQTGYQRNRLFAFKQYLSLFNE